MPGPPNPYQNTVTRLAIATVTLNNGNSFKIVHDLSEEAWTTQLNRWARKAKRLTAVSLIYYIKFRRPHCVCVTKEQYDQLTTGKVVPATEAE